jgi:hypothetical protein
MRCQTELKGAEMTADSVTEVEVGMREAILVLCLVECEERDWDVVRWLVVGLGVSGGEVEFEGWKRGGVVV